MLLWSATSAAAPVASDEGGFTSRIAAERQAAGIPGYAFAADLQAVARRQAQRMADRGEPYHNPNLGSEVGGWSALGENVGMGWDVAQLHQMFMASAPHRANIMSTSFTQIGVGTVRSADGRLWVVEVFRRPSGSATAAPAPAPARAPAPTPAPAPAPPALPPPAPTTTTAPPPPPPPPPPTTIPLPQPTLAALADPAAQASPLASTAMAAAPAVPAAASVAGPATAAAVLIAAVGAAQLAVHRRLRVG